MTRQTENSEERKSVKRWTMQEDNCLLRHVRARPQNLHHCFLAVADEIYSTFGITYRAVTSKRQDAWCFFTASPNHVSKNRKNGEGVSTNYNIWRRLMNVIRNIV